MTYKLIKVYPFSPPLNTEIKYTFKYWISTKPIEGYSQFNKHISEFNPQDYPEFWEKVVKKQYEILSFVRTGSLNHNGAIFTLSGNTYSTGSFSNNLSLEHCLTSGGFLIQSVKRLSDGEVFSVGNTVKGDFAGKITRFEIQSLSSSGMTVYSDNMLVAGYNNCCLSYIKHHNIIFTAQDAELDLSNKSTIIKPNDKIKVKNMNKQDTAPKPRYFVKLTEENYKILNRYLHKHWKNYTDYSDNWDVIFTKNGYFFSESVDFCGKYFHTLINYPGSLTGEILTTHEFLSILDIELYEQLKAEHKLVDGLITITDQPFPIQLQPDFSAADLIIMKHLLDSNIKFDSNDFDFYKSLFQLGHDYSTSTKAY